MTDETQTPEEDVPDYAFLVYGVPCADPDHGYQHVSIHLEIDDKADNVAIGTIIQALGQDILDKAREAKAQLN